MRRVDGIKKDIIFYYGIILFFLNFIIIFPLFKNKSEIQIDKKIRIVQPNISQKDKIYNRDTQLDKLIDLSLKDGINEVDYIIWPESSVENIFVLNRENKFIEKINKKLLQDKKTLIFGGIAYETYEEEFYNSLIVIKGMEFKGIYHKAFLVPFGEYIPFRGIVPFLGNIVGSNVDFTRGGKKTKLAFNEQISFSPNICYESLFFNSVNGESNFILNITNDAWFHNTTGPYQNFDSLVIRSVEGGIPAIRVANSGISGLIDSNGKVIFKTKMEEEAVIDFNLIYKKDSNYKINEFYSVMLFLFINIGIYFYFKKIKILI